MDSRKLRHLGGYIDGCRCFVAAFKKNTKIFVRFGHKEVYLNIVWLKFDHLSRFL